MLRKDVKLGFAIGGVMLAVVVVYVLVVPNNDRNKTNLVTDVTTGTSSINSDNKPDQVAIDTKSEEKSPSFSPDSGKSDNGKVGGADLSKPDNVGEKPIAAVDSAGSSSAANAKNSKGDIWDIALRDGVIPSSTPTGNAVDAKSEQPTDSPANSPTDKSSTDRVSDARSNSSKVDAMIVDKGADVIDSPTEAKLVGDTQTSSQSSAQSSNKTAENTHIVKAGETLSSIAAASYGDAKLWKQISEANPNVNPDRLSAGTRLVIPASTAALNDIVALDRANGVGTPTAFHGKAIDPSTNYQVQPNDSLYRISMHLYGKADHVTKLYDDNKDVIGADPRHLKLGMILKLTDKPAASVTSAAR